MIGVNIRQWFHFSSSILPYEFSRNKYRKRSEDKMKELITCFCNLIQHLRQKYNAQILLLSAYQPDVVEWEDDLPWLREIKKQFMEDEKVVLSEGAISLLEYYSWMENLDLMIGMRLHSSLIALRFGVPALNVSYTLRGNDIFGHLGLSDSVLELSEVMQDPWQLVLAADRVLENLDAEKKRARVSVARAIGENMAILEILLGDSSFGN